MFNVILPYFWLSTSIRFLFALLWLVTLSALMIILWSHVQAVSIFLFEFCHI